MTARQDIEATLLAVSEPAPHQFELTFHAPAIAEAAQPGQFVQVLTDDTYHPLLRRPFSLYRANPERGEISLLFIARGHFTAGLARMAPGVVVQIQGPGGRPFTPFPDAEQHLLVAGGIGAPPLWFFARRLLAEMPPDKLHIIAGARTAELLAPFDELAAAGATWSPATDDGSFGHHGLVTELLAEKLAAPGCAVYACGPAPMMRAVAELALGNGAPCRVSLETALPCVSQGCWACMVPVRSGSELRTVRACVEGPVFDAAELVWQ